MNKNKKILYILLPLIIVLLIIVGIFYFSKRQTEMVPLSEYNEKYHKTTEESSDKD